MNFPRKRVRLCMLLMCLKRTIFFCVRILEGVAEAGAWSSVLTILSLEFKEKTTFLNIPFYIENDHLLLISQMKETPRR
jgi:hypothetical protein